MSVYAFDFFDTLTDGPFGVREDVRELVRRLFAAGHEIHIVSAVAGPNDNDEFFKQALSKLFVPYTRLHRVDHTPGKKTPVLQAIKAEGFWDNLPDNVNRAREAGIPSCLVGVEPTAETTLVPSKWPAPVALEEMYQTALADVDPIANPNAPTDIREHLPLLRKLASKCDHVTEFGTRRGNGSTVAILAGQPECFVTWDMNPFAIIQQQIADLLVSAGRTRFQPRVGSSLLISPIEPTDMLFIDSYHTGRQLIAELRRHAWQPDCRVRKYLVFHDTETFGAVGEDGKEPGLRAAIRLFQQNNFPLWGVKFALTNNNGLVVLERADVDPRPGIHTDFHDE